VVTVEESIGAFGCLARRQGESGPNQ
jgi:hypothetical protein